MSALLFAVHIVYVSKFSEKSDVLVLTLLQFAVGGVCGVHPLREAIRQADDRMYQNKARNKE